MDKNDHSGHRQRLKNRFITGGIEALSDYEIIEMLLFYSIPYKDCKPIAKEIINKYKNLYSFINSDENEMISIDGIKNGTATFILFLKEIIKKYYKEAGVERGKKLSSIHEVVSYLKVEMASLKNESFRVIFLNSQNEFICDEELFSGTIDKSTIYPRNIIEKVIKYNAKSIIFAHNHPSGMIVPSDADKKITKKLKQILVDMDINLLDHIIIGGNEYFSFAENGLID